MKVAGPPARLLPVAVAAALLGCLGPVPETESGKRERIEALYEGYRERFVAVPGIEAGQLRVRLREAEPPVLVDVRSAEEQAVSMIPGAITREAFERLRPELAGRTIVTYCTIGFRSSLFARELLEDGVDALNLEGSILSWTHAGGELVDASGSTRRVHVYGERWDLAADGYESVW